MRNDDEMIVPNIQLVHNRIVPCSFDITARIWISNNLYTCVKALKEHKKFVNSLVKLKNKEYVVSGSNDHTLLLWNSCIYYKYEKNFLIILTYIRMLMSKFIEGKTLKVIINKGSSSKNISFYEKESTH